MPIATGRGSLKVRARWVIEDLARGQWQLVVNELPPGVSSAESAGRN
jgi:topoisomerase-4 subunit A